MGNIKILELFGGIGSPRIALRNLGIPVKSIDYVEIDEKAVRSYNAMFNDELPYKTQSVIGWDLKPDILIHGSPCQDFSIAGKQQGADINSGTRSSLMWETIRIIQAMGEWRPKYVIWENVKNVLSKHMRHNFNQYLDEMSKLGYESTFRTLNAMDFGLPQKRERVFTVSTLKGCFNFDLMDHRSLKPIQAFLSDYEEHRIVTQPSILKRIGKSTGAFKGYVPVIEDFAYTITTKQVWSPNSGILKIGDKYRYLTEHECWRLQGYSDDDYFNALSAHPGKPGKMNGALYHQAGNSIPVTIFEQMFKVML